MATWLDGWKPTRYRGIFEQDGAYRVRVRAVCFATGALREANRTYQGINLKEALIKQQALKEELQRGTQAGTQRVGDFAKLWLATKLPTIDLATGERYTAALEDHVLPELGAYYYDELRGANVQAWVNQKLRAGYASETVRGWFRVLRTMSRDAIEQLDLDRDPTSRITFPDAPEREEPNALAPEQLYAFLAHMERRYYRNYALTCVLAFSGLRFCHASAIRWEDIDYEAGIVKIVRKNVRGRIGPVSRKKRAPKQYPLDPQVATALKDWRMWVVRKQAPGLAQGWCFPGRTGRLRTPGSLWKAWRACLGAIGVTERFTVHGLRRTFNDLSRRAGVDPVTTKSLTGHVTEKMREHYSSVGLDEKRAAVGAVVKLVKSGDRSGDQEGEKKKAGSGGNQKPA